MASWPLTLKLVRLLCLQCIVYILSFDSGWGWSSVRRQFFSIYPLHSGKISTQTAYHKIINGGEKILKNYSRKWSKILSDF